MVTAQSLLHGAVYSLEQCSLLLRDATLLYENGSYATPLVVAAFAREELGRWRILLDLRKEVLAGKCLTVNDVKARCKDHGEKQEAGMVGLSLRFGTASGIGELLQKRMTAAIGSKERKEADQRVEEIVRQESEGTPGKRHEQRMKALYVDVLSEDQWNQPARAISQTAAYEFLVDAIGDYEVERQQGYTELPLVKSVDQELHDALAEWSDRPEMPLVVAPSYPGTN
jgi:AbiV family abortive infection protein